MVRHIGFELVCGRHLVKWPARFVIGGADGYKDLVPYVFFFQAEDGIRDLTVTGVQTCALPIYSGPPRPRRRRRHGARLASPDSARTMATPRPDAARRGPGTRSSGAPGGPACRRQIGRASCRERV